MSQQKRRLRDGATAYMSLTNLDPSSMSGEDLRRRMEEIADGIRAIQSTDYVGTPEDQARVNMQHDQLMARYLKLSEEVGRRG